jgi:hypothetical protein
MRFHAPKAARWAFVMLSATGCADDDATGDEPGDAGEVASFDAGIVTADAASVVAAQDAALARDASSPSRDEPAADAGRAPRLEAGASRGPDDAGQSVDASQDASQDGGARDAAVRDAAIPSDAGGGACPAHGSVRYTLQEKPMPSSAEAMAYAKIRAAMDKATEKYNCYTNLSREVHATYEPGVATADGSTNGSIRFGSDASMHFVTAMHELGHVFGVGSNEFKPHVQNGVFNGATATAEMRRITGDTMATVKSDGTHFWPYGLNYVSEYKSEDDLIGHCALVVAIRKDIGL